MIDFSTFEAFEGEKPYLLLDRHPDGAYLALRVYIGDAAATIWSAETRQLAWSPEDACALSWLRGGTQLAALQVFHQTQLLGEIPLIATVPAAYSEELEYHLSESPPVFLDTHHVMIRLPSGESQIHDLSEFWH